MFDCPTNQTFAQVVAHLAQQQPRPDLLLLTGDISQDETSASYEYARLSLAPLQIPTYWLPGNHDQNPETLQQLNGATVRPDKTFVQGGWRFVLLDTTLSQQPHGQISTDQLQWLEQQLNQQSDQPAQPDLPTLVALHHHPLPCGLTYMDSMALTNAADLFAVLDRFAQVKLVIYGHIHQEFQAQRQGVTYYGTPATCIQLKPQQAQIELDDRPPGYRLLRLYADGRFETTVQRIVLSSD